MKRTRNKAVAAATTQRWAGLAAVWIALVWLAPVAHAQAARPATAAELGRAALALLARANYTALRAHTCPPGQLAFAPYSRNLERMDPVVLTADDLANFAQSKVVRVWGHYDGSGAEIQLTPMGYHAAFVYDVDYRSRARMKVQTAAQMAASSEWSAVNRTFTGASTVVFRYPGLKRNDFKDARELIMVVRDTGQRWCLAGILHSEDTV